MPKPVTFDLLACDTFRPADLGWLTSAGVVLANAYGRNARDGIMPVRSIAHVPAGTRGRFMEVDHAPDTRSA
jgi:hypothetical protein